MKRILWVVVAALAPALAAQNPPDTSEQAQAEQLRAEIQRRFNERVRSELKLTDEQTAKLRATQDRFGAQRRDIFERQRGIHEALQDQLQPGVAANSDSVRRLMDAREQNRQSLAKLEQDEDREMAGYLTPVQRARFQIMRQRLMERVAELRRQRARERMMGPGPRRPQGPRMGRPPGGGRGRRRP